MADIYEQRAKVFKAFCDERRQKILELLQQGEQCACKLIEGTGMAQSTLSYHMKILCESGIVRGREVGKWTHYRIDPEGRETAIQLLKEITTVQEAALPCPACQTEPEKEKEIKYEQYERHGQNNCRKKKTGRTDSRSIRR